MSAESRMDALQKALGALDQNAPARKRLNALFDTDSFVELDGFAKVGGESAGVVTGYGAIDGSPVFAFSQDGPVGKTHGAKIKKLFDLAVKTGAPVVGIYDSNGARIKEGNDALNAYGEMLLWQNNLSGVVPQISVILGTCAGSAAMVALSADFVVMSEKAELFMTAPFNTPDGKLAGAGTAANAAKAGVCDILAKDDADAIAKAKKLVAVMPANNISLAGNDDFAENDAVVSAGMKGADVIAAIADKNSVIELGAEFGTAAYTAIASINWATVAFVATDKAEKLTSADCAKIARFVQLADVFSIPVVTVLDTEGFVPSSEAELAGSVRDCAKLAQVYASATTTKVNLIKGKAFGASYAAFDSADIAYAWENAAIAPMSLEAAKVFMGEEIDASPFSAAALGMIDGVIAAEDSKDAVASAVDLCSGKRVAAPTRKHVNFAF